MRVGIILSDAMPDLLGLLLLLLLLLLVGCCRQAHCTQCTAE